MQELYAKSITRLLKKGLSEENLVKNLMAHLTRTGRTKLLPGILRELRTEESRGAFAQASIEVAREEDKADAIKEAKAAGIEAEEVRINAALLSGWRARKGGALVDRSGKRALTDLYARIVKQ